MPHQPTAHEVEAQTRTWAESVGDAYAAAYAVLVVSGDGTNRRRRVYCTLSGAERAMLRARERGDRAAIALVRLTPVQLLDVVEPPR